MAKPYRLLELEREHGDLHKVIPSLANLHGQYETARRLGVSQFTVSRWLKNNGYKPRTIWERVEQELQPA